MKGKERGNGCRGNDAKEHKEKKTAAVLFVFFGLKVEGERSEGGCL